MSFVKTVLCTFLPLWSYLLKSLLTDSVFQLHVQGVWDRGECEHGIRSVLHLFRFALSIRIERYKLSEAFWLLIEQSWINLVFIFQWGFIFAEQPSWNRLKRVPWQRVCYWSGQIRFFLLKIFVNEGSPYY